jgi:prolycopene isomerase
MDSYHPMGGIQVIPNALADYVTEHGGEMKYRTLVEEILMQGDKAQGIRTRNGEIYRAPFIISTSM